MIEVENTGERILLEKESPSMIARHFCAYKFSENFVLGKKVLDIGCGEGYGSHYLAGFAKEVTGIDREKAIINFASDKYRKDNLRYLAYDIRNLSSFNNKFDVICSFQVIEHLGDHEKFLLDVKTLLDDSGIFICSTPNKLDASLNSENPLNKFHIKEYAFVEFKDFLEKHFVKVEIFGSKRGRRLSFYRRLKKTGLFNFLPDYINPVKRFYRKINCDNFIIVKNSLVSALDFIAVCG